MGTELLTIAMDTSVHISPFQKRVYALTAQIPKGAVCTYKTLAEVLGCRSAQAVGQALKRNPFAPEVPCHRVIRSDGSLGGYMGEYGNKKRLLLEAEGISISLAGYVALAHFLLPSDLASPNESL